MFKSRKPIHNNRPIFVSKEENMTTVTYSIPNISCNHCVHTIKTEVGDLAGVKSVDANAATRQATIVFEPPATEEEIIALLKEINYAPAL
jgi:copper chaperone CopZ